MKNNHSQTLNNATAYKSSLNKNLDLFATDVRTNKYKDKKNAYVNDMLTLAYAEDSNLAKLNFLNIIDVRNGKGENGATELILKFLNNVEPDFLIENLNLVVHLTRWDRLFQNYINFNTNVRKAIIDLIKTNTDSTKPDLLMFKWLPSQNASNENTIANARAIANDLKLSSKEYRKWLSSERKKLNLIENVLRVKTNESPVFKDIPKRALNKYQVALDTRYNKNFVQFIEDIKNKKIKLNVDVLSPAEIVKMNETNVELAQVLWSSQKDFLQEDFFPVIDVSGSMDTAIRGGVKAYQVANGLGVYCAERNKVSFKNRVMLFSSNAKVLDFKDCNNLDEKLKLIKTNSEVANTNINSVFETFLNLALLVDREQRALVCPKQILLISDCQFDEMVDGSSTTNFKHWQKMFDIAGVVLPTIVFWNINAKLNTFPVTKDERAVMISGYSPTILKGLKNLENIDNLPMQVMLETLKPYEEIIANFNKEKEPTSKTKTKKR